MLQFAEDVQGPKIKVIGVGGGGGNSVNTMIEAGIQGVDFVAANTDCQVLDTNQAPVKIQLGKNLTKGLGAGANPEIGCAAALEDASRIAEVLGGADMVFVTAGMGGGTGTGAAPVLAQVARDMGALTVGVVTKPFAFEGLQRKKKANNGISELAKAVDALIVIPNDRLVALAGHKLTLRESFAMVDNVCLNAVRGISDLVMVPGLINVDFADVRTIMTGMGRALMGTGRGSGDKRAIDAAQMAINSPLLEDVSINGATGILVNITGGPDLTLAEVNEACSLIQEAADPDANIIFGSVIDANLGDEVRITVIATGFQARAADHANAVASSHGAAGKNGSSHGGGRRPQENHQIPLPMQRHGQAPAASYEPQYPPRSYVSTATPVPGHRGAAQPLPSEPVDLGDLGLEFASPYPPVMGAMAPYPPAQPMALSPSAPMSLGAPAAYPASPGEWGPPSERPIIRPQVTSSAAAAGNGQAGNGTRRPPMVPPSVLGAEELGIEENEFDKPTYLRRGLAAHDPGAR
jgi:cell division protein FtsZ